MNLRVCLGFQAVSMHLIKVAPALAVDMLTNPNAYFKKMHICTHIRTQKKNERMLKLFKKLCVNMK